MKINSFNNLDIDNLHYNSPQIIDSNTYLSSCHINNIDVLFTTPKMNCVSIIHNKDYI